MLVLHELLDFLVGRLHKIYGYVRYQDGPVDNVELGQES